MNQYKKLVQNSILFIVANMGSKLISFLIVPLYTYVLTTAEYGTADVVSATIQLILPVVSLVIYDGVFRFLMDKTEDKTVVFTEGLRFYLRSCILMLLIGVATFFIPLFRGYEIMFVVLMMLQGAYSLFSQFCKGIGNTKMFALGGIICTVVLLGLNLLFLLMFRMGLKGYFLAYILSYTTTIIVIFISCRCWKYIRLKTRDMDTSKRLIKYSAPMVANTIVWWVLTSSSKYLILYFCGVDANGIYAVANKMPALITTIGAIFLQAWQLSAIDEANSEKRFIFYSEVHWIYLSALIIGYSIVLLIIKPIFPLIIEKTYLSASKYLPLLLYGSIYVMLSQFWTAFYLAEKKTKELSTSAIICGILNIIIGLILTPVMGINGAVIASVIACIVMWIIRIAKSRSFIRIDLDYKRMVVLLLLALIQALFYYINSGLGYYLQVGVLIVMILVCYKDIKRYAIYIGRHIKNKLAEKHSSDSIRN